MYGLTAVDDCKFVAVASNAMTSKYAIHLFSLHKDTLRIIWHGAMAGVADTHRRATDLGHFSTTSPLYDAKYVLVASNKSVCTLVYGATDKNTRSELLNHLEDIRKQISKPWIILGDFNCIANLNERIGTIPRLTETIPLRHCMDLWII